MMMIVSLSTVIQNSVAASACSALLDCYLLHLHRIPIWDHPAVSQSGVSSALPLKLLTEKSFHGFNKEQSKTPTGHTLFKISKDLLSFPLSDTELAIFIYTASHPIRYSAQAISSLATVHGR